MLIFIFWVYLFCCDLYYILFVCSFFFVIRVWECTLGYIVIIIIIVKNNYGATFGHDICSKWMYKFLFEFAFGSDDVYSSYWWVWTCTFVFILLFVLFCWWWLVLHELDSCWYVVFQIQMKIMDITMEKEFLVGRYLNYIER